MQMYKITENINRLQNISVELGIEKFSVAAIETKKKIGDLHDAIRAITQLWARDIMQRLKLCESLQEIFPILPLEKRNLQESMRMSLQSAERCITLLNNAFPDLCRQAEDGLAETRGLFTDYLERFPVIASDYLHFPSQSMEMIASFADALD
jgi:hypothetical protein